MSDEVKLDDKVVTKLSNAQYQYLVRNGEVKLGTLRVSMAVLDAIAPSRTRNTEEERADAFGEVLAQVTPDPETGVVRIPAFALVDGGLPEGSVTSKSYWSGSAPGSSLADKAGYKSRLDLAREGNGYAMYVVLTPHVAPAVAVPVVEVPAFPVPPEVPATVQGPKGKGRRVRAA